MHAAPGSPLSPGGAHPPPASTPPVVTPPVVTPASTLAALAALGVTTGPVEIAVIPRRPETGLVRPALWAVGISTLGATTAAGLVLALLALATGAWLFGSLFGQAPAPSGAALAHWYLVSWVRLGAKAAACAAPMALLATAGVRTCRPVRRWTPAGQGVVAAALVAASGPLWWGPVAVVLDVALGAVSSIVGSS